MDVPLVLDDESWKRLLSLAEAARTAVARQQAGVDEEDVRFLALLTAIEYGAPPAASVPPFVHNVAVRSKNAALHVRRCTADIRDKVASAASDYLSYLEDPSLPTVMDFDDLLTHLRHTCQIIASLPLLNIRYTSIEWDYRELLYLGTALSDMSGIPWPLERVEEDDPSIAPPCHQLPRLLLLLSRSHHQPRHSNQKKTIPRPLTGLERRYPHHLPSGSSPPLGKMHLGVLASSATCLT